MKFDLLVLLNLKEEYRSKEPGFSIEDICFCKNSSFVAIVAKENNAAVLIKIAANPIVEEIATFRQAEELQSIPRANTCFWNAETLG